MELIVVEGPITDDEFVIDLEGRAALEGRRYELIPFSLRKDGYKKASEIYQEWLNEDPTRERIENPTFFIARQVSSMIAGIKQRRSESVRNKNKT